MKNLDSPLENAFLYMNETLIDYAILHSYNPISKLNQISDIDLVMIKEHQHNISNYLLENGWIRLKNPFFYQIREQYIFIDITKKIYKLDILFEITFFHNKIFYSIFPINNLKNYIVMFNNVKILEPTLSKYIYILRILVEKKVLTKKAVNEYLYFERQKENDNKYSSIHIKYVESILEKILINENIFNQNHIENLINKKILYKKTTGVDKIKALIKKIFLKFQKKTLYIGFIGLDGSGKSTLVSMLEKHLNSINITTQIIYLGHKDYRMWLMSYIVKIQNKKLRLVTYIILWPLEIFTRLFSIKRTTRIVLFDRHPLFEPLIRKNFIIDNLYKIYLNFFSKKVDLVFLMTGNLEILWNRKKEMNFEVYSNKYKILKNDIQKSDININLIDTVENNIEYSFQAILEKIKDNDEFRKIMQY